MTHWGWVVVAVTFVLAGVSLSLYAQGSGLGFLLGAAFSWAYGKAVTA